MITAAILPVATASRAASSRRLRRFFAVLAAIVLTIGWATPATAASEPAQGMLLIASPDMSGSWFARSVILLIQHDESGTVGLVINRPTEMAPVDMLPDVAGLAQLQGKLYIGGPVEGYGVMMLVRTDQPPTDAEHVFADVYASGNSELLQNIVRLGDSANRVRLYAGYAGWVPGQLDMEIRRGSWAVVPAAQKYVFSGDPAGIWERLVPTKEPIIVMREEPAARF